MIGNEKGNECDFWIENNTRLDMDKYCDTGYFYYYMEMTIRGNLQDCGELTRENHGVSLEL